MYNITTEEYNKLKNYCKGHFRNKVLTKRNGLSISFDDIFQDAIEYCIEQSDNYKSLVNNVTTTFLNRVLNEEVKLNYKYKYENHKGSVSIRINQNTILDKNDIFGEENEDINVTIETVNQNGIVEDVNELLINKGNRREFRKDKFVEFEGNQIF
jgi:hypothetical protein